MLSNIHIVPTRTPNKVRVEGLLTDPHGYDEASYWTFSGEGRSQAAAIRNAEREAAAFLASLS